MGKSKSKVTETSESNNSKQVEDWNPSSNTSVQQLNLSEVNSIGCADEGLWKFSLEDSKKRRYTVNWEDQSCSHPTEKWETEEQELMIDSGCFWTCLPTMVCTAISNGEFYKRRRCGSEQRGTATLWTNMVYGHVTTNSGRRIVIQITFYVMNVRKLLLSTSALKHRGVTIIFNHDYDRIICRNETVNLISHDCHSYLHITRRALVIAGENATNDMDEGVYGHDGVET